mmetsp:Transcript_11516/g.17822  ORF Transcript_11516/g.17822 Transcript_11516/m.17822 type:complete len:82 (-) Transcript_11516:362-607(-)
MTSTSPQSFAEDDDYTINSESTEGTTNIKERMEFSEQTSGAELGPPAPAPAPATTALVPSAGKRYKHTHLFLIDELDYSLD